MSRYSFTSTLLALSFAGCATALDADVGAPVPQIDYCSDAAAENACLLDSQKAGTYPAVDAIADGIDALGCGYALSLDGETLYVSGTGFTDTGLVDAACFWGQCPWGLDDVAPVGSVSKTLTALAVMRMLEPGQTPKDVQVQDVLPGAPWPLSEVTLHQLLAHTSRLASAEYAPGYGSPTWLAEQYPELDRPRMQPRAMWYGMKDVNPTTAFVDEAAGIGWYSNAAYRILGAAVDANSLYDAEEFVLEDPEMASESELTSFYLGGYESTVRGIVADPGDPLDTRMTTACVNEVSRAAGLDHYVSGFTKNAANAYVPSAADGLPSESGRRGPSGGWMMTAGDLIRLANGISTRRFVSEEHLAIMRTPVASAVGRLFGNGLMILPHTFASDPATEWPGYGHGGDLSNEGHHAMFRVVEFGEGRTLAAAAVCTGDALSGTLSDELGKMLDVAYDDFVLLPSDTGPVTYAPAEAFCDTWESDAADQLEVDFGDALKEEWAGILHMTRNDLALAEREVRTRLGREPEGAAILRAFSAGDLEEAASSAAGMLWRRHDERVRGTTGTRR